jgi:hypothetical protein
MQVGAAVEPPHLEGVTALVVVLADMQGHVEVLDAMEQEPEGEPAILDRLARVLQGHPELVDLVHDTTLLRDVPGELRVVSGLVQGTST